MFKIVCYLGGTCGDLVTSLIDPRGTKIVNGAISLPEQRTRLKKPHLFASDQARDQYLTEIAQQYDSVPSHDFEYHRRSQHDVLLITVQDRDVASWAANRFKKLHREHVWTEMMTASGITSVSEYAQAILDWSNVAGHIFKNTLSLEKILAGDALTKLGIQSQESDKIYQTWLANQI